jgi:hypothetical protein
MGVVWGLNPNLYIQGFSIGFGSGHSAEGRAIVENGASGPEWVCIGGSQFPLGMGVYLALVCTSSREVLGYG